jgi:hypothetical protein
VAVKRLVQKVKCVLMVFVAIQAKQQQMKTAAVKDLAKSGNNALQIKRGPFLLVNVILHSIKIIHKHVPVVKLVRLGRFAMKVSVNAILAIHLI